MRKLILPARFTENSFFGLMRSIKREVKYSRVQFDFKGLNGIEVGGITALANSIEHFRSDGKTVDCINIEKCGAYDFLKKCGFISWFSDSKRKTTSAGDFLTLTPVAFQESAPFINNWLIPWIAGALNKETGELSSVMNCFNEIFNNIRDHSDRTIGHVCAHHNRQKRLINVCVADFGVGIPYNVKIEKGPMKDSDAIIESIQEGFSTRSTERNRGAGLPTLVRTIVHRNSGVLRIISGCGYCRIECDKYGVPRIRQQDIPFCQGTVIYIEIDTTKFIPSIVEEEFTW